jgi:large subunit ribosomal protein L32
MAIPFRKTSKCKRDSRRAHCKLTAPTMIVCPNCGELTLSHMVCKKCGFYKGKLVVAPKPEKTEKETKETKEPKETREPKFKK